MSAGRECSSRSAYSGFRAEFSYPRVVAGYCVFVDVGVVVFLLFIAAALADGEEQTEQAA